MPACADDLDAADLAEQVAQLVARQLLVVDDARSRSSVLHRHAVTRSGGRQLGNLDADAQVPSPGHAVSFSW